MTAALLALLTLCFVSQAVWAQPDPNQDPNAPQQQVQNAPQDVDPMVIFDKTVRLTTDSILASPKVKALKGEAMVVAPVTIQGPEMEENDMQEVNALSQMVQTKLATVFINRGGENLEVIDQVVIGKVMKTLNIDQKALEDPDNWGPIAEKTGAKYILLSLATVTGDGFSVDIRLVNLETKRAIAAGGVIGNTDTGVVTPSNCMAPTPGKAQ
jgi:hypothetical protein